jgi:hypothetical protein
MSYYDDAARSIAAKTALWALPLLDEKRPPETLGTIALETCQNLRTLGIMALLSQGDEQQFLGNLSRSARAWALFLRRAKGAKNRAHHYVSGRLDPLLDGIAAGDDAAVEWVAASAPTEKQGRSEYEDDYCYARLLLGLSSGAGNTETLMLLVERFRRFEDGARVAVCESLLRSDVDGFSAALPEVIVAFERSCAELAKRAEATAELTARASICVEGLALLRLAERRSMRTADEYPFCPSAARGRYQGSFPDEFGAGPTGPT